MKALFRLIVLSFFLLGVGLACANQAKEVKENAVLSKQEVLSNFTIQQKSNNVYFQSEVEVEIVTPCDKGDFDLESLDLPTLINFVVSNLAYRLTDKHCLSTQDNFAFLQQRRAKYLLYHSYKIPNSIVG